MMWPWAGVSKCQKQSVVCCSSGSRSRATSVSSAQNQCSGASPSPSGCGGAAENVLMDIKCAAQTHLVMKEIFFLLLFWGNQQMSCWEFVCRTSAKQVPLLQTKQLSALVTRWIMGKDGSGPQSQSGHAGATSHNRQVWIQSARLGVPPALCLLHLGVIILITQKQMN